MSNVADLEFKDHGPLNISNSLFSPDSYQVQYPICGALPPDRSSHFTTNIDIINGDPRIFPYSTIRLPPFQH